MGFSTNIAPGAAGFANTTIVVAVSTDNRIFYNWWNLGEAGHGWRELEGNGRTDAAPAISIYFTDDGANSIVARMVSAIKGIGTDGNIYTNIGSTSGVDIGTWFTEWTPYSQLQTNLAPAATVSYHVNSLDASPVLVATTTDGHIFYNTSFHAHSSPGWVELDRNWRTDAAPAAALVGSYLFVVVKGLDGQLYLNQGNLGKPFVGWQPMGFTTNGAPGATSSRDTSVVVATSTDGRIFYNWWHLGGAGQWRELEGGGRTDATPAAALVGVDNNYLFVVIKGLDGQLYLNQGNLGKPFVGWQLM
jgi:hypothetical protein